MKNEYGTLCEYKTGNTIRPATQAEWQASREAERSNIGGGTGVIEIDGQSVYVEGGPELKTEIKWEAKQSINAGEAIIVGTHAEHGDCLYAVLASGACDLSDNDTDGDFGGAGWPSPPAAIIAEASALAKGNPGI